MAAGDEILSWLKGIRNQTPIKRTDCPECDWPLEETKWELHCTFCGWTSSPFKAGR